MEKIITQVADFRYIQVYSKRGAEVVIMQLLFIGYRVSPNRLFPYFDRSIPREFIHGPDLLSDMKKAGYILINKENKTIMGSVKMDLSSKWGFPKNFGDYTEITIKELTE